MVENEAQQHAKNQINADQFYQSYENQLQLMNHCQNFVFY